MSAEGHVAELPTDPSSSLRRGTGRGGTPLVLLASTMRIAQIAPLFERVPPDGYGGTERVVSYLTEELVQRGHDVTLYASGDSRTSAHLIAGCERALRPAGRCRHYLPQQVAMLDDLFARIHEYDVVHFHIDCTHYPLTARSATPAVTTLHGRLDVEDLQPCFQRFRHLAFVSISDHQRLPVPWIGWQATVYHGLPRDLHTPVAAPGDYLAFLGRMSPEKGCETAFTIAERTGLPLRLAGKLDVNDQPYWSTRVAPRFGQPGIEYVGEIGGRDKDDFLGGARALLFPIDWPEPFGLVMIEAMACGTPVIAFRRGSVPEVIEDGLTGFIVDDVDGAVAAIGRLGELDRRRIRARFEERFSVERMTDDYLQVYEDLVARGAFHVRALHRTGGTSRRAARPSFRARRP
jgi:glycosyltransferase involved in cell wall biosynthesis